MNRQIFRALLSIASAALLIRIMGMLNQTIVSSHFGAGASMDAYLVASLIPILVAQLAIGAIENAVIPVYARIRSAGTREQASVFLSTLLNLLLVSGALITALMFVLRRQVVFLSAPALDPARAELAVHLTPFLLPVLLLMVAVGFLECILNVEGQFGWPAYAGILVPIATAVLVVTLSKPQGIVTLCLGMVLGLLLQVCVFLIRARRAGLIYRPVVDWRLPDIGLVLVLAWPALLGALVSQISPLIDQVFASFLSTGSISAISYSLKLFSVPLGVIALSVGRAAVPYLSRQAAMHEMRAFKETLHLYLWVIGIGTAVLSIGMLALAHPLVRLFFQRGQFTAADTNHTATTLIGFVVGLAPTALVFVLVRAFSALGKTRVLMAMGIFNVIANFVLDALLAPLWQSEGIALATSAMYSCALVILYLLLRRTIGEFRVFTPPPEILEAAKDVGRWFSSRKEDVFSFGVLYGIRRPALHMGLILAVFATGVAGVILNYTYALRITLGSLAVLAFLRYRYALLLLWVLLAALISSPFPIFHAQNLTSGLTAPSILLMVCLPFKQGLRRMPALVYLTLFLLWVFAGVFISPTGINDALTLWLIYLNYVAVSLLAIYALTTEKRMEGTIDAILLLAAFVASYGLYGYLTKQNGLADPSQGIFRIVSVFGSPPSLALFLSIIIPLALYRITTARGVRRIAGLVVMLVLLAATGLTFTRSAFLAVPLSILIMTFFLPSRRMKIGLLSTFMVLTALAVLLAEVSNIPIFTRFFEQDITTLNGRTNIWQALLARFDPTQLLGKGLGAANAILGNLGVNGVTGIASYESHNLYLGILYDHGIIGAALLIAVFVALFASLIAGIRKTTGKHRLLFITACATCASVALQSIQSNDVFILGIGLYFWVIMALPFALCWSTSNQRVESNEAALEDEAQTAVEAGAVGGRQSW